jgi:hypothetical protein
VQAADAPNGAGAEAALMRRTVAIAVLLIGLACAPAAVARTGACRVDQATGARAPYVAQVRTNLTAAAIGGGSVCAYVRRLVGSVQREGYAPTAGFLSGTGLWTLHHHLVYPAGWPRPSGPVWDPHVHVTLWLAAAASAGATVRPCWIALNEYT